MANSGIDALANIVISDYVNNLNLSLFKLDTRRSRLFARKDKVLVLVYPYVKSHKVQGSNQKVILSDAYLKMLLTDNKSCLFISADNFSLSSDTSRIATQDFRILIDDLVGRIPKQEMLHAATITSLMLAGLIEYSIGYKYLTKRYEKYGKLNFVYQANGYLHLRISKSIIPRIIPDQVSGWKVT